MGQMASKVAATKNPFMVASKENSNLQFGIANVRAWCGFAQPGKSFQRAADC